MTPRSLVAPPFFSNLVSLLKRYVMPSFQALREGMIWLIPCLMFSSFALFFASMGEFYYGYRTGWVDLLYRVQAQIADFFPYLMTATISYVLAMQWKLSRPPLALLSILYLVVVAEVMPEEQTIQTFKIVIAIISPLIAIPLLAYLQTLPQLALTRSESAGKIVKESLNLVLPGIIVGLLLIGIHLVLFHLAIGAQSFTFFQFDYANEPFEFGLTFAALNSVLWFFGIHGYYALLPLVEFLQEASTLNYSTYLAGGAGPYAMNLSLMGTFVFIGGSGATLSLVVALLLFSKQKSLRLIAIASIPIGMINVNEILLFGLPIIFNPRLFLPFLVVPMLNVVTSLLAIQVGFIEVPSAAVPFNSPIIANAWIASDGDINAVMLQLFNVLVGCLIYYPAVCSLNRIYGNRTIHIDFLDTSYMRRQEEAEMLNEDPIAIAQQKEKQANLVEDNLESIGNKEFCMEYQPQISPMNGKVVGCEALIRAKDSDGSLIYPGAFLPWLEAADLMKELDVWVFSQVVKDIMKWNVQGVYVPVSVNISPQTLVDPDYIGQIEQLITPVASQIHIEITEETLLVDENRLALAFNRLHLLGVSIYIDDFGTGYSSLSYLNRFEIDAIKVDRSFVLALETDKGHKVFSSVLSVAEKLQLAVVVEGVETQQQLQHIPIRDDISVQGWYYSRSLGFMEFIHYCLDANKHASHAS